MKRVFILSLILASLLLFSCQKKEEKYDYELYYTEEQNYKEVLSHASEVLSKKIDREALYYRALCNYQLGYMDDAASSATLYYVLYPKEKDDHLHNILGIILYYGDEELAFRAAEEIEDNFTFTRGETMRYFQLLMEAGRNSEANVLFESLRESITNREAAMMAIAAKADSALIVSNLEAFHSEEGETAEFMNTLVAAMEILLDRNEGGLLLPLALKSNSKSSYRLCLAIGDVYRQLGDRQRATEYWAIAQTRFPDEVRSRLYIK